MDALDRLHQRLVGALRRAAPDSLERPLTIADIYQHLVPYRLVRAELGFTELKEYEHALLRLLSGEREYARVDLPQVAEEFRRELRAPNPILGLYRDYAAVGIALNPDTSSPARGGDGAPQPDVSELREPPPRASAREGGAEVAVTAFRPEPLPAREPAPRSVTIPVRRSTACWSCREPLPAGREARFCPLCGAGQLPTTCPRCQTQLEPAWKFCIECGVAQPQPAATERLT